MREKMTEKEEAVEHFTNILNIAYDRENVTEDFKREYVSWCSAFSSEYKLFKSMKPQSILLLKPSRISRILITVVLCLCTLETYTKFDKSYAYLGLCLYMTVVAMNLVSNIFIMYQSSPNEYILEVGQYFESFFEMFKIFKNRLDVIRQKCNWNAKLLPDLNAELEGSKYDLNYVKLLSSVFHLYDMYGIITGFMTFLLCQYMEYEIFPILETFTICLLFGIAFAKDVKCFRLREKLKETTKRMKNLTTGFLIWFENNSEMCKFLHQYDTNNCIVDIFPLRSLKICRKPKFLNCAVSIIACEVFSELNASRNDFVNALLFLAYGNNLDKITVKTIDTQMNEQSSKESTLKKRYQIKGSSAWSQDFGYSKKLPKYQQSAAIGRSGTRKDDAIIIMPEKKSNKTFTMDDSKNENIKSSFVPMNTDKTASFPFSKSNAGVLLKNKSSAKSFDESLPLRYELQRNEAGEETEFSNEKLALDVQGKNENVISSDKSEYSKLCDSCSESCVSKILLCKSCSHGFGVNSIDSIISIKELGQNYSDLKENVKIKLTKENEICSNKEELLESECKDIRQDVHSIDTSNTNTNDFNKTFITNDYVCSCKIRCNLPLQCTSIDELVANGSKKLNDSNLYQRKVAEAKLSDESETIDKDAFDGKNDPPIKITNKNFTTNTEQHDETMSIYAVNERKTYADGDEMQKSKFNEICKSEEQVQMSNSSNKSDKTCISDHTHNFEDDCSNLTKECRVRSSSIESFERAPSEINDSNAHEQKEILFTTESSGVHIPCDTCSYESFSDKLMDNAENCSNNKNSENELNEVIDSDSFELRTNEIKSDTESRDIYTNKISDAYNNKLAQVTNETNISKNTIKYMETDTNKTETSENKFNENKKLDLHEQKVDEIKSMSVDETNREIFTLISIRTNPNENADKNVLDDICDNEKDCETYLDENEILEDIFSGTTVAHLHSQSENGTQSNNAPNITLDISLDDDRNNSSELIGTSSSFIEDVHNINLIIGTSNIAKSNDGDINDSLAKNIETCLNSKEKSENVTDKNKKIDFNQKSMEKQLNFDVNSAIISNSEDDKSGINVNPNFRIISHNLEEMTKDEENQHIEKDESNFVQCLRNKDINQELLSEVNINNIQQTFNENILKPRSHHLFIEDKNSVNKGIITSTSDNAHNDNFESFPFAIKEDFIPENVNIEQQQNIEIDNKDISDTKVIKPKTKSGKKCNRKKRHFKMSQKKKQFNVKHKETIKSLTEDSVNVTKHFSDPEEAFSKESNDLEKKKLISNGLENLNLESEVSIITTGIARNEHINILDVSNRIERENSSQQTSIFEILRDSNETIIKETIPRMYLKSLGNNEVSGKKPNDSVIQEDCCFDSEKDVDDSARFQFHTFLQENNLAEDDEDVLMQCENLTQIDKKIEMTRNENYILETPLCDDKSLWYNDKYTVSMDEMVDAINNVTNNLENADTMLHFDRIVASNESNKEVSHESNSADNAEICLIKAPTRIIIKGKRLHKNFKNRGIRKESSTEIKESSTENVSNANINTDAENSFSTVSNKAPSLNERKIHLAEQSPLKLEENENEVSGSEKNSCQEISEEDFKSGCSGNMYDETIQNKRNGSAANISDSVLCKENKTPEKCAIELEVKCIQPNQQTKFKSLTSHVNSEAQISKCNEFNHPRNTLIRLWKDEHNKMFEIFPKYRSAVKRKIIHMEKELRTHFQSDVPKLPIIDVKENECFLQTEDGDKYFNSKLEVSCKCPGAEYDDEKKIQSWLTSVPTTNSNGNFKLLQNSSISLELTPDNAKFLCNESSVNSHANVKEMVGDSEDSLNKYQGIFAYAFREDLCEKNEISDEDLINLKTPLTGSSDDSNMHFHPSTSPSDRSSDASNESDLINFECSVIDENKNTSLNLLKMDGTTDILWPECSKTLGGVKWVSDMISNNDSRKMSDNQSKNCTNNTEQLEEISDTARNLKSSKLTVEPLNEKFLKDYESDLISFENEYLPNAVNLNSSEKYTNQQVILSDAQMNPENFVTLRDNHDQYHFKKTDPLNYHLKYKNLDLQVLDFAPSVTIRLIDEKDDSSPTLTPTWRQRCIGGSLSSSDNSINELQLITKASSFSNGETLKEDINITKGELKMQVKKSEFENAAVSSETRKNVRSEKTSSENTGAVNYDSISDRDTLMFTQKGNESTEKITQDENNENHPIISEFHKIDNFVSRHIINKNDNPIPDGNADSAQKIKLLTNSSLNQDDNFDEQYFGGSEISETDTSYVCDPIRQCSKKGNFLVGTETTVIKENEYTKDFEFEAKGVKLTCKPDSEADSVEVKFRQLEDKTKLTFKSGSKKLYVKLAP